MESHHGATVCAHARPKPEGLPLRTAFVEAFEREGTLILRPPVSHAVMGVVFFLVFELVGWGLIYVNFTYPSSDWQPMWEKTGPMRPWSQHSFGDQLATICFLTVFCGAFIAGGCISLWMGLNHFRPWTIWRDGPVLRLSHGRGNWSFNSVATLRLTKARLLGTGGVALMLEGNEADGKAASSVRLHRMFKNKGLDMPRIRSEMCLLADRVASFLGCPVDDQTGAEGGER